jgi:hypothetical protein
MVEALCNPAPDMARSAASGKQRLAGYRRDRQTPDQQKEAGMTQAEPIEAMIALFHGVTPPNPAAHRFAADIAATIAAFEAQRGALAFEDEPADFLTALHEAAPAEGQDATS